MLVEVFSNFSADLKIYKDILDLPNTKLFISLHTHKCKNDKIAEKIFNLVKSDISAYCKKIIVNVMLETIDRNSYSNSIMLYKHLQHLNKTTFNDLIAIELVPVISSDRYVSVYSKTDYKIFMLLNNMNNTKELVTITNANGNKK